MIFLSEQTTREILELDRVLEIIEDVARATPEHRIIYSEPPTSVLSMDEPKCRYRLKACALADIPVVGLRIIGYPLAADGPHSSTRFVMLSDPTSGEPLALIDDHWNYTLRTAASAVVGLRHLLPERPVSMGLVGAGNLARAMVKLLRHIDRVASVRVTSRRAESREAFGQWVESEFDLPAVATETVADAVADAELVVTATNANSRLVERPWLADGTTLCTLGRYELAPDVYAAADKIIVDSWNIAKGVPDVKELVAAGILGPDSIHAELHELVTGTKPGRTGPEETIIFRTDGLVSQDVAIGYVVYQAAVARGLGVAL